jgi:hypothetical protein
MQTSGYSETPLAKKLGIKEGFKIALIISLNTISTYSQISPKM